MLKSEQQVENSIDISDLPAGVYVLNLSVGNKIVLKIVIKN